MTRSRSEASLAQPVVRYLRRKGFSLARQEVQFYEHRMDLYACTRNRDKTVAVELKLENWRRAFQQALLYQLCADLVFVAMPKATVPRVDQSLLERHGIGLISVSDRNRCAKVLEASPSTVVRPHYRETYVENM